MSEDQERSRVLRPHGATFDYTSEHDPPPREGDGRLWSASEDAETTTTDNATPAAAAAAVCQYLSSSSPQWCSPYVEPLLCSDYLRDSTDMTVQQQPQLQQRSDEPLTPDLRIPILMRRRHRNSGDAGSSLSRGSALIRPTASALQATRETSGSRRRPEGRERGGGSAALLRLRTPTLRKQIKQQQQSAGLPAVKEELKPGKDVVSWREVHATCHVSHYNLSAIQVALEKDMTESEFYDKERQILTLNGAHLLEKIMPPDDPPPSPQMLCFVLENGVVTLWGLRSSDYKASSLIKAVVCYLKPFSSAELPDVWKASISMSYCLVADLPNDFPVPTSRVNHERLFLKTGNTDELVAASLALAQSTRLSTYEEAVDEASKKFEKLPRRIAANEFYKYFSYESNQADDIRKWVAEVFSLVIDVNIVEDFLDVPECFWESDHYQPFWRRVHRYLDVEERVQILNTRVKCIQEILRVVQHDRVEAQGIHLMWVVIFMLAFNVIAIVIRDALDRRVG